MFTELLSNIDPITRGLTSTSAPANVIFGYTKLQSDNMKLPDSSKYQYYPWRSNQITRASQALVGKYVAALGQARFSVRSRPAAGRLRDSGYAKTALLGQRNDARNQLCECHLDRCKLGSGAWFRFHWFSFADTL